MPLNRNGRGEDHWGEIRGGLTSVPYCGLTSSALGAGLASRSNSCAQRMLTVARSPARTAFVNSGNSPRVQTQTETGFSGVDAAMMVLTSDRVAAEARSGSRLVHSFWSSWFLYPSGSVFNRLVPASAAASLQIRLGFHRCLLLNISIQSLCS